MLKIRRVFDEKLLVMQFLSERKSVRKNSCFGELLNVSFAQGQVQPYSR